MQTFLPSTSFSVSASYLDNNRLNKQRFEAKDILFLTLTCYPKLRVNPFINTYVKIFGYSTKYALFLIKRYQNHPAVAMWQEFPCMLIDYFQAIQQECNNRKFADLSSVSDFITKLPIIQDKLQVFPLTHHNSPIPISHQSCLLKKFPSYYSKHFPPAVVPPENVWWRRDIGFYKIDGKIHYPLLPQPLIA